LPFILKSYLNLYLNEIDVSDIFITTDNLPSQIQDRFPCYSKEIFSFLPQYPNKMSFRCFIKAVEFVGEHTLLPLLFCESKASKSCASPYQSFFLPPRRSDVYPLARSHQLPVLQNHRVNDLPADQTFPSPKLLMGTVKFVIDHRTPAAKTFRKKQFIH
jgi:hypothetical protein